MEKGLSVGFLTYIMVIQTKTYASLSLTLLKAIYDKQWRKSHVFISKRIFLDVETTFRRTSPYSNLHCLPRNDHRKLCANTRIRLATRTCISVCRQVTAKLFYSVFLSIELLSYVMFLFNIEFTFLREVA